MSEREVDVVAVKMGFHFAIRSPGDQFKVPESMAEQCGKPGCWFVPVDPFWKLDAMDQAATEQIQEFEDSIGGEEPPHPVAAVTLREAEDAVRGGYGVQDASTVKVEPATLREAGTSGKRKNYPKN